MTVEEIFSNVADHMIKGMMVHESLANYYDLLGLQGYKRVHEYHYMTETCEYRGLCRYYINHYNKLLPETHFESPDVIPNSWYGVKREDIDSSTKRTAVKNGLVRWLEWEKSTKILYEKMYIALMDIEEVAGACKVKELVMAVDKELKHVERYLLNKISTNYDMNEVIAEQKCLHDDYKRKLQKDIKVKIC